MRAFKNWIKRNFTNLLYGRKKNAARKKELDNWLKQFEKQTPARLSDTSFDIFTYHGEDGIIHYLLSQLKNVPPVFADIGAGNCITGNCSTLAVHDGWKGIFIDKDAGQIALGKKFYGQMPSGGAGINFIVEEITNLNIDQVISNTGIENEIGLLSIDIDGNDYWIWKNITVIRPRIVVIEAKVEFGIRDLVVPYGNKNHRSVDPRYNGASVEALRKLGIEKGYKLVGANKQGYNLFFIKEQESIPATTSSEVLWYPGAISSFYPPAFFKQHKFVKD